MSKENTHKCNGYRSFGSYLGEGIAVALIILSIAFGIGGCNALVKHGWPNQPQTLEQKD